MCGITGVITDLGATDPSHGLRQMNAAVTHRGPDDEGYFETIGDGGSFVGLGHRRLSIIDLTTGKQPIGNEDRLLQVVCNGEIYNYRELRHELVMSGHEFSTNSDTEIIVHAYEEFGEGFIERLRGMFAFAIWDGRSRQLLLGRDRFGQKPLFLFEGDGLFLFASEIKAIVAWPGMKLAVDQRAVLDYLAYRYVPGPSTLFAGIRKLLPGTLAIYKSGTLKEHRYYRPPDQSPRTSTKRSSDPVGEFLEILEEAVSVRMMSDVPFGAFLSGGIDSSAIVALMARNSSQPIKTFSVGFSAGKESELGFARQVAERFGTDHHELCINETDLMDQLPKLVRFRDAPVSEPSDVPIYLLANAARHEVKMVLTGEGSDEFLGGYKKHVAERYVKSFQALPGPLRRRIVEPAVRALPFRFRSIKTGIINLGIESWNERMPRWFGALSTLERRRLVTLFDGGMREEEKTSFEVGDGNTALRRILYFDQTSWLPDNLLERGDRMTMAASLEARMPFLDHHLAAFVSSLPDRFRVRGRVTKWILRNAMKRVLPPEILTRKKIGFRVPVSEWFRGPMREFLQDHLRGTDSLTRSYYRTRELDTILDEHLRGRQNHEKLLWTLLNLEIWHRVNTKLLR